MDLLEMKQARLKELADRLAEIEGRKARFGRALSPAESREVDDLATDINALADEIAALKENNQRQEAVNRAAIEHGEIGGTYRAGVFYTRTRDQYDAESDRIGRRSWFADLFNAEQRGDVQARQRIAQFENENRATTTGSFGGLVVPQYLVQLAALVARSSRPFANTVTNLQIPAEGMTFDVPRGTTGASAASQNGQNTNVSNTDQVWTDLTTSVVTIAGQQDVSRQSLERGTPGLDTMIFTDLARAYFQELDRQTINGSGSAGQLLGTLNTSGITAATAYAAALTTAKYQSKVAGAATSVLTSRFLAASHLAVAPRRWGWLCAQVDGQGRPIIVPSDSQRVNAVGAGDLNPNMVGDTGYRFAGLNVVVDPNMPTNVGTLSEDVSIVYRAADLILWEDGDGSPRNLRFEQTLGNQLTVKLVAYGYTAFVAGRYPTAVALTGGADTVGGNGQIAPVF